MPVVFELLRPEWPDLVAGYESDGLRPIDVAFVALTEKDEPPAGALIGRPRATPTAILEYVVVDPAHRGRGVGSELIEEFCKQARTNGATQVYLHLGEVSPWSEDGQRLRTYYERLGFSLGGNGFYRALAD